MDLLALFLKKEVQLEFSNYRRRIILFNTGYRIFFNVGMKFSNPTLKILSINISVDLKKEIKIYQIQSVRQILRKTSEHIISTFPLLTGFKDALLTIIRNKLLEA
jgi:hypothetical protein